MTQLEDFIITTPYPKTQEDEALINQASPLGKKADDWEKNCLDEYKARVKEYYRKQQHGRCAYCRTYILTSQAPSEIEHIEPKSKKSEWMYESYNLCMSCKSCNTKKSITSVLVNDDVVDLPHDSEDYKIIHPHIDRYSDHINLIEDIFYEGLTAKGVDTIDICGLDRYELASDRAMHLIQADAEVVDKIILALVERREKRLVNIEDKFLERIQDIIDDYKATKTIE